MSGFSSPALGQSDKATEATLATLATSDNQNPLDKYSFYADETTATLYYYCGEDKDGNWYISRETLSTHVTDYVAGTSDVATAWTNRGSKSFSKFSEVF
ncbi:hypothetical protein M1437_03255 [Patescibacteria group bacterium]|nr:hypothetical protein [Patescibacteria group bacterium]